MQAVDEEKNETAAPRSAAITPTVFAVPESVLQKLPIPVQRALECDILSTLVDLTLKVFFILR